MFTIHHREILRIKPGSSDSCGWRTGPCSWRRRARGMPEPPRLIQFRKTNNSWGHSAFLLNYCDRCGLWQAHFCYSGLDPETKYKRRGGSFPFWATRHLQVLVLLSSRHAAGFNHLASRIFDHDLSTHTHFYERSKSNRSDQIAKCAWRNKDVASMR